MSSKIQFTQEGFDNLKLEHEDLIGPRRAKAVDRLAKARAMGDLSENSEYSAAKEEIATSELREKVLGDLDKVEPSVSVAWREYEAKKGE